MRTPFIYGLRWDTLRLTEILTNNSEDIEFYYKQLWAYEEIQRAEMARMYKSQNVQEHYQRPLSQGFL